VQEGDPLAAARLLSIALDGFKGSGLPGRAAAYPGRFEPSVELMRLRRVTRRELAEEAGLDPGHFDRVFRAEYGESPMTMARRFRLERLRRDLLDDDAPLETLALRHGCSEASALIRFFVREAGETPGAYRERVKRSIGRYIGSFGGASDGGKLHG
ncbi:AraC family transcriptional regulator, partial [bacterium]